MAGPSVCKPLKPFYIALKYRCSEIAAFMNTLEWMTE
jgi:hypothetical protein